MRIKFKEAPEIGWLKVVSDEVKEGILGNPCPSCALSSAEYESVCKTTRCASLNVHFVKVDGEGTT